MKNLILIFCLFFASISCSQESKPEQNLKTQINQYATYVTNNDIEKSTKLMYPRIYKYLGGNRIEAVKTLAKFMQENTDHGVTINKIYYDEPGKILYYEDKLQTTIIQNVVMDTKNGQAMSKSTMIAISDDGIIWKFFGVDEETLPELRVKFPELSPDLIIHKAEMIPL